MQGIGHILIGEEKIKVLWRTDSKTYVALKLRKTGDDGICFTDESLYLAGNSEVLKKLREGQVIKL